MTLKNSKLQPVRGTQDVLPEENISYRFVEDKAYMVANRYGFGEITTPIFEFTDVFLRTLGDASDIVTKEMYTFTDRGGENITLRPEGTAGVARAFISNGLSQQTPLKLFYRGPMFRYERPQKGRRRQFRQVGIEFLGLDSPLADLESICLAQQFLSELDLEDDITLEINTLGDTESRTLYRQKLVEYFTDFRNQLSRESIDRLDKNPLRILDSKHKDDIPIIKNAPPLQEYLNDESKRFFEELIERLSKIKICFTLNDKLVRGLDYYSHTVFEFTSTKLGSQGAVLAGGRYDNLISQMGGPRTPGVGWAAGVERIALLLKAPPKNERPFSIIPINNKFNDEAFYLAHKLRKSGLNIDLGYKGNLSKRLKRADKLGARAAVLIGEDEIAREVSIVRDMDTGKQEEVLIDKLDNYLKNYNSIDSLL